MLQKHLRGKFYAGLETREGFLEEVTYEFYLNHVLDQVGYRMAWRSRERGRDAEFQTAVSTKDHHEGPQGVLVH